MNNLWTNTNYAKEKKKYANGIIEQNLSENREELVGALYRTSSENQRDNDSIDTQQKLLLKWINNNRAILIEEYHEEATSAFHNVAWERPELMRMLNDVKEGTINHGVFFKRDRLARDIDSTYIN